MSVKNKQKKLGQMTVLCIVSLGRKMAFDKKQGGSRRPEAPFVILFLEFFMESVKNSFGSGHAALIFIFFLKTARLLIFFV